MKSNRMGKWLPLLTALLMLLVSGCATLGPDFRPPEVETPAAYRSALPGEGVEFNLKWWNLFQDPDLYQIVTQALANNRDLGVAASRIVEARAALGFTEADRLPRIDLDVGAMTGNYSGGSRSPDTNSTAFIAPTINWEIDFWGKFSRANEAARADLMASQYALDTVQLTLISEVVSAYYQLLDFQQREVIARETLDSRLESLDIIQQRFDQGTVPEIDLNQAQIQKEIAAGAIPLYQRSIAKVENALSILMGRLPGGIRTGSALTQQPIPPDIPMGLPADLLTRRPDIAQAFYQLKAQTARIGVAEALRFPSISLTGVLGLASSELSSITSEGEVWSLGGGLVAPLLDFGKNRRRVEIEEERARQALLQYENIVLTAFREVEDGLTEIETYRSQLTAVKNKLKAAQSANQLSSERYDQGVTSYLEVLDSQRAYFSVALEASELKQQYLNAYVRLYKALGGGWITRAAKAQNGSGNPAQD